MGKKFIYSILAFVLILAAFGFWYFQRNIFSKEVLKLDILGPDTVEVGQKVDYTLKYKNNGEITLTNAKLTFEYPEESLVEEGKRRFEKSLNDIYPGEEKTMTLSARILGQENELKIAKAWLEFQPKNLKARYEVLTSMTSVIKFSPLTFDLDLSSRVETDKDFSFSLNYFSNIDYPLSQLRVKIEYPPGFEFVDSTPQALEKNEWLVASLNKAQGGRIKVSGRIKGDVGEQKVFKANLGLWQEGNFVLLKEATKGVEIIKPTIYLSQLVNSSPDYSASAGDSLHYEIFFKNIGGSSFENLFLVVGLDGNFFDLNSLRAPETTNYHQGDNSLIWDWKKNPQLRFLGEGEEGKAEFWINLKDELPITEANNKNLVLKDSVSLSPAREEFTVKVNSKLVLEQKGYFSEGTFNNSGFYPPKIDQRTTFTAVWGLKNFYNDLRNVKIKAVLPPGTSLTGQLLPRESNFLFDSQSREIVWEIGEVSAGSTGPSLSFQVALTPNSSQIGSPAEIVGLVTVFGDDAWTQETITGTAPSLDTNSLSDANFIRGQGIVQ
ncbi:MAG: hypothetical protein A2117_00795 [Candidatus Wildermuthbacteria bacterium GWA2_46_15]|uniref:DUF11 domain-containing protein n=1 Tax=Candidatus Wildermuthbacteria bacterium GWA2_46_15 TaxID=1802443 RepID=A0A1G2QNP9_9BACT|nr:MAG: hypothetical protein A2117_00795 [Candidatus Wildermuthbacteria bacterium GWA2_46_15]